MVTHSFLPSTNDLISHSATTVTSCVKYKWKQNEQEGGTQQLFSRE